MLQPRHDLAHEFGEAEREDHEIDAGNAQRRQADNCGQRRAGDTGQQDQHGIRQNIDAARRRVHANAEERGSRQRDVVGRPREQQP